MPFFWKIKCLNLWKSTCRLQASTVSQRDIVTHVKGVLLMRQEVFMKQQMLQNM